MGHGESKMSESELKNLNLALTEYKRRGFDIDYFLSGDGAPGSCVIV